MRRSLPPPLALAAAIVAAALFGCEGAPVRHPKAYEKVALSASQASADVALGIGSCLTVTLPAPADGLAWEITSNNNRVLEQMGPLGTGTGVAEVSFYSLKPGKSMLRFMLVKPGESVAVPVESCELTVRVRE